MDFSPVLSVIIPVYNDPGGLEQTLRSLVRQENATDFEIIVVDNNSTDKTPHVIDEFEETHPDLVFGYLETKIQGSYAARNTGIEHASGDFLAFIDADVTVEDTWIADVLGRFQNSDVDYLGCNVEMYIPDRENTIWARYDVAMGLPVEHYLQTKHFAPTCSLVVRKEVIEQVGRFDETLVSGGDKEFGNRVAREGLSMEYADEIVVRHPARTSLKGHVNKAKRIGRGQTQLWQQYDLASHPLSLERFLPPSPSRVKKRSGGEMSPIIVYLIELLLKQIQGLSSLSTLYQQYCRNR